MSDRFDDEIRAALQAEADDVHAGDDLLEGIRTAVPSRSPQRARWLLVAAALALVVGVGAILLRDEDDRGQRVDVADDPSTSTSELTHSVLLDLLSRSFPCTHGFQTVVYLEADATTSETEIVRAALAGDRRVTSSRFVSPQEMAGLLAAAAPDAEWDPSAVPTAYVVTANAEEDDLAVRGAISDLAGVVATSSTRCEEAGGDRPALVALVRDDGWLVTVDMGTGRETELHSFGDPRVQDVEGGPYSIDAVELSPDGQWVYFSTCCEPAVGTTFRMPVTGGEPEQVAFGAYPRLSPDGRYLATAGAESLWVASVDQLGDDTVPLAVEVACCTSRLAWSPDGTQLAMVNAAGARDDDQQVLLYDWNGSELTPADVGKPDNPGSFVSWTPDGMLNIAFGGPVDDDRSLSQDASYRWLLWVDESGVIREQAGHESSERDPIRALPRAIAADW
jgi:hypothetical protein